MRHRSMTILIALSLIAMGACTSDDKSGSDGGTAKDSKVGADLLVIPDAAPGSDAAAALIEVSGTVEISQDGPGQGPPVEGATVELLGVSPAKQVTTAADGKYKFTVPKGVALFIHAHKAGLIGDVTGILIPQATTTAVTHNLELLEMTMVNEVAKSLGTTIKADKAIATISPADRNNFKLAFKAAISAKSEGSFVFEKDAPVKGDQTKTDGEPQVIFYNVDTGTTTIDVTVVNDPLSFCQPALGKNTAYPLIAGSFTEIEFICATP
ncbi:MAG: hypothetical protein H6707_06840 [Deltaproteobacteria bacterium]|nr:hypothetical protein [Deltaproteobacteria bacterium]